MIVNNTLYVDLEMAVSKETVDLDLELGYNVSSIEGDIYDGEYMVSPSFEEQVLNTKNKVLTDDVTIGAINVSRISNPQGGNTVYIGGN